MDLQTCVALWERGSVANTAATLALAQLAGLAIDRGDWTDAGTLARRAR